MIALAYGAKVHRICSDVRKKEVLSISGWVLLVSASGLYSASMPQTSLSRHPCLELLGCWMRYKEPLISSQSHKSYWTFVHLLSTVMDTAFCHPNRDKKLHCVAISCHRISGSWGWGVWGTFSSHDYISSHVYICSHELSISMICVVLNLLWIDSDCKRLCYGDWASKWSKSS